MKCLLNVCILGERWAGYVGREYLKSDEFRPWGNADFRIVCCDDSGDMGTACTRGDGGPSHEIDVDDRVEQIVLPDSCIDHGDANSRSVKTREGWISAEGRQPNQVKSGRQNQSVFQLFDEQSTATKVIVAHRTLPPQVALSPLSKAIPSTRETQCD